MVISYHTSQILVAICSLDDGMAIIGRRRCRRCRHSILLTFVCVYLESPNLFLLTDGDLRVMRVCIWISSWSFVCSFICFFFFFFSKRNTREKFAYKQCIHIHTINWQEHLPFLEYSFISFRFVLAPPNSQLVFCFVSFLSLSSCCCCCCHVSQPRLLFYSHTCIRNWYWWGHQLCCCYIVLCYFIHSFTFVLILLLFVATQVRIDKHFFSLTPKAIERSPASQQYQNDCTLIRSHCVTDLHCLLSFDRYTNYVRFNH